jgi:hypothetical protein
MVAKDDRDYSLISESSNVDTKALGPQNSL